MKKRIFIVVFVIIILMSSCQEGANIIEVNSSPLPSLPENITEIENVSVKLIIKSKQNVDNSNWVDLLQEKYNIDLKVISQSNNNALETLDVMLENKQMDGLIYLWWGELFDMIPNPEKYFIPLDDILSQNYIWNVRSDDFRNFALYDDKTWGIPTQYRDNGYLYRLRLYNGDIMDKLELKTPNTFGEFYETMMTISEAETVRSPILYSEKNPFEDFYDIFWSNNIPVISPDSRLQSIIYNFEENSFIDYAQDDSMKNAISFIKLLIDTGLVNKAEAYEDIDQLFYQGETATVMNLIKDRCTYTGLDNIRYALGFDEINKDFKIPALKTNGMYAVLKDTVNPDKMVNKLINSFLLSEDDNLLGFLGDDENKYDIGENVIAYKGSIMSEAPNIFGLILMDKFVISVNPNQDINVSQELSPLDTQLFGDWNENIEMYKKITEEREFISIPPAGMYIRGTDNEILSCFQDTFSLIFNKNVNIEDLYFEYEINMQKLGAQEYISELNKRIGN